MRSGLIPLGVSLASASLVACSSGNGAPELVTVLDLVPRAPEAGERMELVGSGFPEGRPATLTFKGELHRPGQPVVHHASIVVRASGTRGDRVSWILTDDLVGGFSGTGPEAFHTTFHGDVIAAFAPRRAGTPPITGVLHEVSIDFPLPQLPERVAEQRRTEAESLLRGLGLELAEDPARSGVIAASVAKQSRAAQAGLLKGDVIVEFNGSHVRQASDLVPRAGQRLSRVLLKRPGLPNPLERMLPVEGVRPAAPAELVPAGVLVALGASVILVFVAPVARFIGWTEGRLALRLRSVLHGELHRPRSAIRRTLCILTRSCLSLIPFARTSEVLRVLTLFALCAVSAAFAGLSLGVWVVAPEVDLLILFLSSLTALVVAGLIAGGARDRTRWSLGSGLRSALSTLGCQIPALAALVSAGLSTGSFCPESLVESQGGLPWQWAAFRTPFDLAACGLFLALLLPETSPVAGVLPEALPAASHHSRPKGVAESLVSLTDWLYLLVAAHVGALAFLGGWALPRVAPSAQRHSFGYQALGAGWLTMKAGALVLLVLGLRWALGRVRVDQVSALSWRWLVPISLGLLGLSAAWAEFGRAPLGASLRSSMSLVLFGACLVVAARMARHVLREAGRSGHSLGVNPWL